MTPTEFKQARKQLGFNQQQLADKLGLSRVMIGLMERDQAPIERRTELALKYLLNNTWSTRKPTTDGIYWYRQKDGTINDVTLFDDGTTETSASIDEITEWWGIVAWCGPIEPPPFELEIPQGVNDE